MMRSKAQAAAMHAAAAGKSTVGIPQGVAKKFVADSHGQNVKKLPMHAGKKRDVLGDLMKMGNHKR